MSKKLHWWLVVYEYIGKTRAEFGNYYIGEPDKVVTKSMLDGIVALVAAALGCERDGVVITSVSYLGKMTEKYFEKEGEWITKVDH